MGSVVSMEKSPNGFNAGGRWAPCRNVLLAHRALERTVSRSANLPGFAVLHGPSGYGKSMAASYCANKMDGVYVECRSHFTKKTFVASILREMGIRQGRTIGEMMDQAAEQLDKSQRPLIIDEADYLVDRRMIELVRDLHESARTTIMLIGEEHFLSKLLRRSERFHNRVLVTVAAQPASLEDVTSLARLYCPDIPIADDLLDFFREKCRGCARYICVNIDAAREAGRERGEKKLDREWWGKRAVYTGEQPRRVV